jgi:hypothetical protein
VGPRVRTHPASARGSYGSGANPARKNYPTPPPLPMPYGFVLMHNLVGPTQPKNPSAAPEFTEAELNVAQPCTYRTLIESYVTMLVRRLFLARGEFVDLTERHNLNLCFNQVRAVRLRNVLTDTLNLSSCRFAWTDGLHENGLMCAGARMGDANSESIFHT